MIIDQFSQRKRELQELIEVIKHITEIIYDVQMMN